MTPPQKVTSRYSRNLLVKGTNNEFEILSLKLEYSMVDDVFIGTYFVVQIGAKKSTTKDAVGATPEQAVFRCLGKFGVTFR